MEHSYRWEWNGSIGKSVTYSLGVHGFRVHRSGLPFFHRPCELTPGPTAMPQYLPFYPYAFSIQNSQINDSNFWTFQAPGFMGRKDQATPKGHCAPRQYPNRSLGPPWCDSFTCRSSDYALFQTWLFAYTVLVIDLGQGLAASPLWGLPLQRPRLPHWNLCLMILKLAMGCNGGIYPNLAKIEAIRINFDCWKDLLPRPWHHLQVFLP